MTAFAAADRGLACVIGFRKAIASGLLDSFLKTNIALANRIGINGTPGWVVGDQIIDGAVGLSALDKALSEARRS